MICAQCGTDNGAGGKFCLECGAHLASGCPNCGAQNPPNAKFCGECGTGLAGTASSSTASTSTPTAERRLVSVLFADLVGFTTLSQDEDPEDTRDFLTRYFELARTIVERYGGTIEKFIGDAVMAVWGTPTTHEDDAERAVRAALEIVDGVPGLGDGRGLKARAGVLTGQAAVTLGASGQGMVAGDLVNTASRLQSVAPAGAVLVGEATVRAAGAAIRFEEAGDQLLKGKTAPVLAWRVVDVVGLRGGTGRSEALEPPFVGRDEELRLIKELFHATQREQKARLVSIVGQGGMGKSRLAWEFEKYIDGFVETVWWHDGRSPAYGEGISYWALAEMVRGRAGIAETDDPQMALDKLRAAVAQWITNDEERRWVEPRLAALLALEQMPVGSRDELFAAWRTFFDRIAAGGPVVLVFEDIQWADEGMLDFVTELLDRSRNLPIFVITLTRPELFDRRPSWGSNLRSLTTMSLEPLERAQMVELVTGTVPGIPDQATAVVVDRADGIPLYAVETLRMLLDRGDLQRSGDGRFELSGRLETLAVPDTLQALIAARLDALGEHDRRLLQAAAVVGQSFRIESLAAVAGEPATGLAEPLAALVRRQMLHVELDPRSPERGQYQFVQSVVREVAEASLSRADRRALHLAAARYYESLGDEELAGVQASHYVEAYRATPAGPEADALAAQARISLRAAADRAIALHSNRQAVSYLEQALAVTPDAKEQAALHERAVDPAIQEGILDVAMKHASRVQALGGEAKDAQLVLVGATLVAQVNLSEHREKSAIEVLEPAIEGVRGAPPTKALVSAERELARALMLRGSNDESIKWIDRVLDASTLADDRLIVDALITKGTALLNSGQAVQGEVVLRGAIQVAERTGDMWAALRARNNLLGAVAGDNVVDAIEMVTEGVRISLRTGNLTWAYQFGMVLLDHRFELGDWDTGLEEMKALDPPGFYGAWLLLAQAGRDVFRGHIDGARTELADARELVGRDSSQGLAGAGVTAALLEFATGDWSAAIGPAREACKNIDAIDMGATLVAATAVAANEPVWAREAFVAFDSFEERGILVEASRQWLECAVSMLNEDWPTARSAYLSARRGLSAGSSGFTLAMLELSVGQRGRGNIPEAADADAAAREFFRSRGAQPFLDRYDAAFVRTAAIASRATAAESETVPNKA